MMNKNMNSPTKLTEFAPLSPEESQPAVASLFSKFFGFGKSTVDNHTSTTTTTTTATSTTTTTTTTTEATTTTCPSERERESSSRNTDSWRDNDQEEKEKFQKDDDCASAINFPLDASEGRSLPNVLKRISNIVALKSNNLKSYKDSQLRNYWMPDSVAKQCYECGERFTAFRRRHHCRVCGQIFCSKCCSDEIPGKIMGCTGDLRVCTYCCKVVLSYLESSDMRSVLSADLKALQEDLQVKYGNDSRSRPQQNPSNDSLDDEARVYRKSSVGYMEEKYALGRSSSCYLGGTRESSVVVKNSGPLRIMYEELFRSGISIPLQTHRVRLKSYYNCFMGNELVNWMLMHKKAATRTQASAIGQALLDAGFIDSAQSENSLFSDGATLFKPRKLSLIQSIDLSDESQTICDSQEPAWVKNIPQHDSTTDSESDTKVSSPQSCTIQSVGRLPSTSSSFYLDLNLEASTVTLKRPTFEDSTSSVGEKSKSPRVGDDASCLSSNSNGSTNTTTATTTTNTDNSSIDGTTPSIEQKEINSRSHRCESGVSDELLSDTLQVHEFQARNSWHKVNNLKNTFGEMTAYNALTSAYKQHEDSLIAQLLNKEGLSASWREPILSLAHNVVDYVRPDLYHNADDMDIGHYVQIKKLPGGKKNDCEIVSGIVCSKNVAHRGMNAMIANPKILLLECGLMYQRVEGKLLSLEPVMMQEKEYLGHTVARITALGPDVVLVHRSVSRLAQDRLRECGITLVLNVKLSVLEKVARCTGGTIVGTIDAHLTTRYKLGTCNKFYLRNFPNESGGGGKTLMYFEGCLKPHLGATILLRGAPLPELKRVKNVMSTMIFASYSWRLEKSFLMDEFAKPPSSHGDDSFLDEDAFEETLLKVETSESSSNKMNDKSRAIDSFDSDNVFDEENASMEKTEPANKSTPDKNNTEEKTSDNHGHDGKIDDAECFMSVETFKRVSTMLEQHSDPYDTLKLFKSKTLTPKFQDDENPNASSNVEKSCKISMSDEPTKMSKLKEKIASEEKRVYGESVSDQSDPLHKYLKEGHDDYEMDNRGKCDKEKVHCRVLEDSEAFGKAPLTSNTELESLNVADLPLLNKFKKALDDTILSFSPYLKFSVPYLETEAGRNCELRRFFPKDIFYSAQLLDKFEGVRTSSQIATSATPGVTSTLTSSNAPKNARLMDKNCLVNLAMKPQHPFVQAKLTCSVESRQIQALVANFRACGSRLYPSECVVEEKPDATAESEITNNNASSQSNVWPDCLEPANHQRLSVLFSSFSHSRNNAPAFCVYPAVVNMDLYGRNDIALGRFLERYCLTSEYKCPAQACRAQIAQHARRFAHDGGCVHISLTQLNTDPFGQANSEQILMWTKCIECKSVSAVVPMSPDTWSLSFAKYLELRFHGGVYGKRGREADSNVDDVCRHSLHHEHAQYFTKKNMLAVFKYIDISLWEISFPPPFIDIHYDAKLHANIIEEIKMLALKGDEVFTNIRDKLSNLQLEMDGSSVAIGGSGSIGNSLVASAKQQLAKEQQYFKNKIEEAQLKLTSPTLENKKLEGTRSSEKQLQNLMFRIEDGLVILKRLISEAVSNWNARIQEMAAKRKDERSRRFTERSVTSGPAGSSNGAASGLAPNEPDGYVTEDTASESQLEDLSPMSADYSAVDAISAIHKTLDAQNTDSMDFSDNDTRVENVEETLVTTQESPKYHQRSHSDVLPMSSEDMPDRKRKKKTILSQLLPSATLINPISNPLGSFEHHLLPLGSVVPMVVYESEPSSIIAYALDSHDYKHALAEILRASKAPELNPSPLYKRKFPENKDNFSSAGDFSQSGESKRPSVLSFLRGNSPSLASPMETADCKSISPAEPNFAINTAGNTGGNPGNPTAESEEDKKLSVKQQTYIQVQFNDATTNFYCRIYFAAQFAALRENVLPAGEDGFTRSLCRSVQWAARGGKSGSAFCKTRDDRFILKELSRIELQIFLEFAPNYFAYMEKCQQTKQPTLLGKIVGVYRVSFKNNTTNAALRTSVLVMENLFYGRAITDKFDLKGSVRNRLVNPEEADSEGELVLLDENLLNMSCDSPLYIRSHSKAVLNKAIERDTKFLADNSVMDYSLLVGLEPNSDELVLGIIDYIRTFTWDKKLETMVKKSGILGGQGKLPTIVSPEEYRARFIAAMHRYFLPVPDRWTGLARGVESS